MALLSAPPPPANASISNLDPQLHLLCWGGLCHIPSVRLAASDFTFAEAPNGKGCSTIDLTCGQFWKRPSCASHVYTSPSAGGGSNDMLSPPWKGSRRCVGSGTTSCAPHSNIARRSMRGSRSRFFEMQTAVVLFYSVRSASPAEMTLLEVGLGGRTWTLPT